MIKLLDLLISKYHDQPDSPLVGCRGLACVKAFHQKVDAHNLQFIGSSSCGPRVELAALPSAAQFLNVIESVFSGMARAVIHNSDYSSVDECKQAIDRDFHERNDAFTKNPSRAGNVIWGKEREQRPRRCAGRPPTHPTSSFALQGCPLTPTPSYLYLGLIVCKSGFVLMASARCRGV